ncbi:hypothetical protein BH23GEM3_BH23GEM3_18950 [soil metagenome]
MQLRALPFSLLLVASGACAVAQPLRGRPAPQPDETLPPLHAEHVISAGVRYRSLVDAAGPWAIHIVEVDPRACGVQLRTFKAGERLVGRARTSAMAAAAAARWGRPALAAINGDFFTFDPAGVPVGAQVSAGEIVRGPTDRPVFGLTADGAPFIATVRVRGGVRTLPGFAAPLDGVNTRPAAHGLSLYNQFVGDVTPPDTGVVELTVRLIAAARLPGDTARAVVLERDTLAAGVPLPDGGAVLAGRGRSAIFLRDLVAPGDTLMWWTDFDPAPASVAEMIGGFPRLLIGGEAVHDRDPAVSAAFAETRHPRTAVGWRGDGTLLLVTVDGRQPQHSVGMSLAELAELFRRLGAVEALNLDGGGSTTMVVRGLVVNRPSDRDGERTNANAIVVLGAAPGECAARAIPAPVP